VGGTIARGVDAIGERACTIKRLGGCLGFEGGGKCRLYSKILI